MTLASRWNFVCRAYSNLGMLKISFGLFPLARYSCKRLQKIYGLGEPVRYLNMLYPHFQKESCSFDVGQAVMSSRGKCDKRHISFLTSIYREGTTQKVCSFALHICDKSASTVFRENSTCAAVVAMHPLLSRWVNRGHGSC